MNATSTDISATAFPRGRPAETPSHPRPVLWVPLLSHYQADDPASIDEKRAAAQLAFLRPYVSRFLIAGSTGDGWDMHDATFTQLGRGSESAIFGSHGRTKTAGL